MTQSIIRNQTIDSLKGWAIFLVVWGHTIQYMGVGTNVLNQPIGIFIYSFHMPLFFFVSGYFPESIIKNSLITLIKKKVFRLLVPTIVWSVIGFIILQLFFLEAKTPIVYLSALINSIIGSYWFVYVLLMCVCYSKLLIILSKKNKSDENKFLIAGACLVLALPQLNIPFGYYVKFFQCFFPFYIMGWIFKRNRIFNNINSNKKLALISTASCISMILGGGVIHQGENWFVYNFNIDWYNKDFIISFLMFLIFGFIGILLSYSIIKLIEKFYCFRLLNQIGKVTLGIYLIQGIIFDILKRLDINLCNETLYALLAVLITLICYGLVRILMLNHNVSKILL